MVMTADTLASPEKLNALLEQVETELAQVQPRIEELESMMSELKELKLAKQRLLTLKMSLAALLENFTSDDVVLPEMAPLDEMYLMQTESQNLTFSELSTLKTFHPDKAFQEVDKFLKQKQSLNYQMFKAVVFKGGKASTDEIREYLIEIGARQPQSGEGFETAPLSEISSRANYLVRKGVLKPADRGQFFTPLGWVDPAE